MKKFSLYLGVIVLSLLHVACGGKKKQVESADNNKPATYHASVTMLNDLQHTKLELEPDFANKELKGTATLLVKPHFYAVDSLILNAKHMRIESVDLLNSMAGGSEGMTKVALTPLNYGYDTFFLRIKLDRRYSSSETYTVRIKYVAMPEKAGGNGSQAISDSKGVYFITPTEKNPDKPMQMWTQGETEAASCWFPTIDAPNQKTTEELSITVPIRFTTISNGRLDRSEVFVRNASDSMRTDHWMQDKPHAPYLFAVAVGEFAEVKDQWRNIPVNYYVEKEYEPYARLVFGHTPEMIEFFSNILRTPYAWDKYHQVVVRDFVSGAMENTSCVIHFDKLQHNSRQHLDNSYEEVVSHELFHHWFGDLVTCESWSNLPLNESFATYGEYLWDEYKYGRDEADEELQNFRDDYFGQAEYEKKKLIRYDYDQQEDMFDAHSYQKGGLVLHSLRKYVGDEAFFESLRLYLQRNRFSTAELSDLRKCFEEVTGEDLNWFFNQWFLQEGHPVLQVDQQRYGSTVVVKVKQLDKLYKLPFTVQIGSDRTEKVMVSRDTQSFVFKNVPEDQMLVFDGQNQFLGEMKMNKSESDWKLQFNQTKLAYQKIEAFEQLYDIKKISAEKAQLCKAMINHSFHGCRSVGMQGLYNSGIVVADIEGMREQIVDIAMMDPKASVRYEAVRVVTRLKDEKTLARMLNDSSYSVAKRALLGYGSLNRKAAYDYAQANREVKDPYMLEIVYTGIGKYSDQNELPFFIRSLQNASRKNAPHVSYGLSNYIVYNHPEYLDAALDTLVALHSGTINKIVRANVMTALKSLRNFYYYDIYFAQYYIDNSKGKTKKKHIKDKKVSEANYKKIDDVIKKLGV